MAHRAWDRTCEIPPKVFVINLQGLLFQLSNAPAGVVGSTSDLTETSYCQESGTRSGRTFLRTLMSVLEDFQVADTHRMI